MIYAENIQFTKKGIVFTDKHGVHLTLKKATEKIINRIKNWFIDAKLYFVHLVSDYIPFYSIRRALFTASGLRIGAGSTIHMQTRFFSPKGITIGKDTIIGFRSFLDGRSSLTIGDHVDIASEVMIYNSEHDVHSEDFHAIEEPVIISDYVFIGPRTIIMPGVKIGRGAVVAAAAVVTKNVDEFVIVAGVPAKVIGVRKNKNPTYRLGRSRLFQ